MTENLLDLGDNAAPSAELFAWRTPVPALKPFRLATR
jgi:hypothetical protein